MGTVRKAFGHISKLLKGLAAGLHLPDAPSGCPKRSEGGFPATAQRKCVRCTPYKRRPGGASERLRRRQPPPLPVRYAGIAHPSPAPTEPGLSVLPTRRRGGVLRRDIGDAKRCERIFRKRPQGARSEARAGSLRRRGGNIRSTASRTRIGTRRSPPPKPKPKRLNTKALIPKNQGFICARYWDRTSISGWFSERARKIKPAGMPRRKPRGHWFVPANNG